MDGYEDITLILGGVGRLRDTEESSRDETLLVYI